MREFCTCWAMGLGIGPICRWWRGCAETAKTTCSQASGHYEKRRRTPISENCSRLFRRLLLSSDEYFICVDLLVFSPTGLEYGHFPVKFLKLIHCGPDPARFVPAVAIVVSCGRTNNRWRKENAGAQIRRRANKSLANRKKNHDGQTKLARRETNGEAQTGAIARKFHDCLLASYQAGMYGLDSGDENSYPFIYSRLVQDRRAIRMSGGGSYFPRTG